MDKTAKDRMKRYRNKKRNGGVTQSPESVTVSPESVTESVDSVTADVTQKVWFTAEGSHPVLKWLIDPEKRKKMELIVESLKKHNQLHNVSLGCGKHSLPLDIVGEMLECTR